MSVYYPSAPLLDRARAGRPWHAVRGCAFCTGDRSSACCVTTSEIAEVLGVAHETVQRWKAGRRVSGRLVDGFATRLGAHPGELWPDWWANCPEVAA